MVKKVLLWLRRVTAMRVAIAITLCFAIMHFTIESEFFEFGPLSKSGFIHLMDLKALDLKFQRQAVSSLPAPKVVIAAIDEKGVERYGLWPWSRATIAEFVRKATQGGAKVIGFDAVFSDEDKNSSYTTIKKFVDELKGTTFSPESKEAQAILAAVRDAEAEHARTMASLTEIERHTKKRDKVASRALDEARQSANESKKTLTQLHTALDDWKKRAVPFFERVKVAGDAPDDVLAAAIADSPQTILGYFNFYSESEIVGISRTELDSDFKAVERAGIEHIYESVTQSAGGQEMEILRVVPTAPVTGLQIRPVIAIQAPLHKFADKAQGFGYFNVSPDPDGPMRRIRMLNRYRSKLFPALSLLAASRYLDGDIRPLNGTIKPGQTLDGISLLPGVDVPTDMHARLIVNYYTDPQEYFPSFSVADFIEGTVPPAAYKGKVVLFGMTAQGLFDLRPTPFSATTPGVYIHASAIQNMIDGRYLERYYGLALIELLAYIILGIAMGFALPKVPAWAGLLGTLGFAIGLYIVDIHFIFPNGIWILNVLPTMQALVVFTGVSLHGYLTEGREKRQIRKAFQFYLTKSVVDEMLKDTSKLRLGGERRVCTVLFSDIRGFTTISEKLTPEELVQLLNSYLTPMTDLVFKYDGTLDKYMGDAIMAIFGAPVDYVDHASRACYVCLEMMEALGKLQIGWRAQNLPELDIGIGLNTGPMSVGNMGSDSRFDYTVMGDNVNLGSRLEGINKTYGTNIIISEYTYEAAKNDVHTRLLDAVRVKGKKDPVRIFELLGRGKAEPKVQEFITAFEGAIDLYKKQQWDNAIALFERVRKELRPEDYASEMYIERCQEMKAEPPGPDWDGVYTMTTK